MWKHTKLYNLNELFFANYKQQKSNLTSRKKTTWKFSIQKKTRLRFSNVAKSTTTNRLCQLLCKTFSGKLVGSKYPRTINQSRDNWWVWWANGGHRVTSPIRFILVVYWWCADVMHRNDRGECCFVVDGGPLCTPKTSFYTQICVCVCCRKGHTYEEMRAWNNDHYIIPASAFSCQFRSPASLMASLDLVLQYSLKSVLTAFLVVDSISLIAGFAVFSNWLSSKKQYRSLSFLPNIIGLCVWRRDFSDRGNRSLLKLR